jgi:hypothetical protein
VRASAVGEIGIMTKLAVRKNLSWKRACLRRFADRMEDDFHDGLVIVTAIFERDLTLI